MLERQAIGIKKAQKEKNFGGGFPRSASAD